MNNKVTIYKVVIELTKGGFSRTIISYEDMNIGKSMFSSGTLAKRITKDKINKIDSIFINSNTRLCYYTYCFLEDITEQTEKVKTYIKDIIIKESKNIDAMIIGMDIEDFVVDRKRIYE